MSFHKTKELYLERVLVKGTPEGDHESNEEVGNRGMSCPGLCIKAGPFLVALKQTNTSRSLILARRCDRGRRQMAIQEDRASISLHMSPEKVSRPFCSLAMYLREQFPRVLHQQ